MGFCWDLFHIDQLSPQILVYEPRQPLYSLSIDLELDALTAATHMMIAASQVILTPLTSKLLQTKPNQVLYQSIGIDYMNLKFPLNFVQGYLVT